MFEADQLGRVIINNEGNTTDTYFLNFENPGNFLIFEKLIPVSRLAQPQPAGTPPTEARFVEIPIGERIQIPPGERAIYEFRSRLRDRPLVGSEKIYPFVVRVVSSEEQTLELPSQVSEKGFIPIWLLAPPAPRKRRSIIRPRWRSPWTRISTAMG
jgi:hypothetical protein